MTRGTGRPMPPESIGALVALIFDKPELRDVSALVEALEGGVTA